MALRLYLGDIQKTLYADDRKWPNRKARGVPVLAYEDTEEPSAYEDRRTQLFGKHRRQKIEESRYGIRDHSFESKIWMKEDLV